jgi:rhodanese-related sulfurtransferase
VVGASLGIAVNAVRPHGVALARYLPPTLCTQSAPAQEIRVLPPPMAARLCGDSRTLVVDVRSGAAFAEGHVASAVHLPCSGSHADLERVRTQLVDKEALVVYGDSEEQAHKVASDLGAGIGRPGLSIAVIAGGWRAWLEAGLACAAGPCDDCEGMLSHATK